MAIKGMQPAFSAANHANDTRPHLLVAASGSVATIKLPNIIAALAQHTVAIRVILTPSASQFLRGQSKEQPDFHTFLAAPNVEAVYEDSDEWHFQSGPAGEDEFSRGWMRGDPILHIELRKWADLMLIAPLSANMLAKIANGMSDGLLSSVVRAWDTTGLVDIPRVLNSASEANGRECSLTTVSTSVRQCKKRILVAPAMNTAMWSHPITARQIAILTTEWGVTNGADGEQSGWFEVLTPISKGLACGDVGSGAMMEWHDIVEIVERRLGLSPSCP